MKKKKMDPTAAADSVSELCADLIAMILLKLSIKTLIRFKLVSKTWLNIITSHCFTSKHYYYSLSKRQSGSNNYSSFFILRNPSYVTDDSFITSLSVRGDRLLHWNIHLSYLRRKHRQTYTRRTFSLMFSVGLGLYCIYDVRFHRVALWNPATREIKVLPHLPLYDIKDEYGYGYLCGRAEVKDGIFSYKLGILVAMYDTIKESAYYSLDLYDSNSNSWKVLTWGQYNTNIRCPHKLWEDYGVNLNGLFHHLSTDSKRLPYIMTFDYTSEVFSRLEVPDLPQITGKYFWNRSHLTLCDDKFLCLVIYRKKEEEALEADFDVWVMREYGIKESWSKEYTTGHVANNMNIMGYSKRIGGIFLQDDKGALCLCDCPSSTLRLRNICPGFGKWKGMQVLERTESLVSINGVPDESERNSGSEKV